MFGDLDEGKLEIMKTNYDELCKLGNTQLIMLALAELVSTQDDIPIGKRIPLQSALETKAGTKCILYDLDQKVREVKTGGGLE